MPASSCPPWKLLFMPSTQVALTLRQIGALLELPDIELTVVAGRHARTFDAINESGLTSEKCRLIGWTDAMPRLLCLPRRLPGRLRPPCLPRSFRR